MQAAVNPAQGPQLRDIHLPLPPSWWPPAPGWWLLAVALLAISIFLVVYLYKKIRRRRWRKSVMAEFDRAVAVARDDGAALATALSTFLRRLAMRTTPAAATLAGDAWLQHLDGRIASDEFSTGVGRALIEAPYRAHAQFDAPALVALVRRTVRAWIDREGAHA
jgi:hypothetical protein